MMKGSVTTILTVCPIRSKPDDTSEMISQLLFGEQANVIEKGKADWCRITAVYDGYQGWIDSKQLVNMPSKPESGKAYCLNIFDNVFGDERSTWVTMGAELSAYDGMTCKVAGHTFRYSGQAILTNKLLTDVALIERLARKLLNTPYLWGGRTPTGIDCSGFSQLVFKCAGIRIMRDARDQATQGETVDFVSAAQPGDLAFFTKQTERISHVGIVLPYMQIIHASGKVRIDTMDHYGIFNNDLQQYTHRLKIIKRYF